ncbi:MAG: hypothetical protein A2X36_08145 [Elusimicrobia bacterium GWA2_69_24]|nr:MAG: hypothetical protein A2X36_08145 [Elusimicrobia bacterium GWA2_69_24]HBL16903.1 hypothetical protein [Elusimicrobiota bacterium]
MNRHRRRTAAAWLLGALLSPGGAAFAAFEDIGAAARGVGMGNAFTGLADDAQAGYYNPAGLAQMRGPELVTSYGRLHLGLDDGSALAASYLGYAQPLPPGWGTASVSWSQFSLLGYYQEQAIRMSYGRPLGARWKLGATVKWLSIKVTQDDFTASDPVFDYGAKDSVSAFGFDAGALYQPFRRLRFGLALQDLNRPDLGFGGESRLPVGLRAGAAYPGDRLMLALDVCHRDGELKVYTGAERWDLGRRFALRGGLGVGTRQFSNLSVGMGFKERHLRIDYAFLYPLSGLTGTAGTHRVALSLRWGRAAQPETLPEDESRKDRLAELADELSRIKEKLEAVESSATARAAAPPPEPPPAPKVKAAPKRPPPPEKPARPTQHAVQSGDSLRSLAVQYYGDPARWVDLYRANRGQVGADGDLKPGQTLMLP